MSGPGRLSPLGTARERFLRGRERGFEEHNPEPLLPPELLRAAEGFELDDAVLYQAWELTRCAPRLDRRGQRALLLLAVAALVNLRRGSPRLPLSGKPYEELLKTLGAKDTDLRAISALLESAGRGEGPAADLVGAPGDYKPFIVEAGSLYLQRMRHFEDRLVESLGARLASRSTRCSRTRR